MFFFITFVQIMRKDRGSHRSEEHTSELQSPLIISYAVHLTAGDGFAAKGFVTVADEAGQFGRIALQILRHSIEEGEEVGILPVSYTHLTFAAYPILCHRNGKRY